MCDVELTLHELLPRNPSARWPQQLLLKYTRGPGVDGAKEKRMHRLELKSVVKPAEKPQNSVTPTSPFLSLAIRFI